MSQLKYKFSNVSINGVQNFGTKISTQTVIIQTNMNHHVIRNQFLFNFLLRLKIVTWSRRQKIVHKSTIICPPRQLDFVAWIELDWIEFSTGILFETWMRWNDMWVFRLRVGLKFTEYTAKGGSYYQLYWIYHRHNKYFSFTIPWNTLPSELYLESNC